MASKVGKIPGVKALAAIPEAEFDSQHPSQAAHKSLLIPILRDQMPSSGLYTCTQISLK